MPDRTESSLGGTPADTPQTPPHNWSDDGVFRAAFLRLFPPEDRATIHQAGAILASQAQSGDTADRPILDPLLSVAADLGMAGRHLLEIAEWRHGSELDDGEIDLCRTAEAWAREIGDRSNEIECRVREVEDGTYPDTGRPLGEEVREAERIARRLAEQHPDPEARRIYRQLAERAAAKAKGEQP
jgi:hypothetical protein